MINKQLNAGIVLFIVGAFMLGDHYMTKREVENEDIPKLYFLKGKIAKPIGIVMILLGLLVIITSFF